MAEASPSVLAHVAWMLRGTFEDLSTEALAYILNKSDVATEAFRGLLQQAGANVSPIHEAQTQVVKEGGERPDLACLDGDGNEHVLMEAKFDALLTENQPVNYLRYLPKDRNSALLVVAPRRRLESLWDEMMQRIRAEDDFTIGDERQGENVISAPMGDRRTFMLTSWDHLLGLLKTHVRADDDEGTLRSIAELQGVVEYENLNAFYAPSGKLSDLDDENRERLRKLVHGAIEAGRREGWADMTGYSSTYHEYGYTRYFKMHDVSMSFSYDTRLWECLGGPLWLGFQDSAQEHIGEIRDRLSAVRVRWKMDFYHDVLSWSQKKDFIRVNLPCSGEFQELLQALLVELREIASALKVDEPDSKTTL